MEKIIATAGYNPANYKYEVAVMGSIVTVYVRGNPPMSVLKLEEAAKKLKIKVNISQVSSDVDADAPQAHQE